MIVYCFVPALRSRHQQCSAKRLPLAVERIPPRQLKYDSRSEVLDSSIRQMLAVHLRRACDDANVVGMLDRSSSPEFKFTMSQRLGVSSKSELRTGTSLYVYMRPSLTSPPKPRLRHQDVWPLNLRKA